jgi:hypothetical protein
VRLARIDIEFQEYTCYLVVSGLKIDSPLEINAVTFLPLDTNIPEFEDPYAKNMLEKANAGRDCLSCSQVIAEWERSSELHEQKTEEALNIIRYIASLLWHDQPPRAVNVASRDPKRSAWSLVVSTEGVVGSVSLSKFTVLPITLEQEFLLYANARGLNQIQEMIIKPSPSEIEQSFLTAIQWFGQATQELLPLVAFIKYYISIETILKKIGEKMQKMLFREDLECLLDP